MPFSVDERRIKEISNHFNYDQSSVKKVFKFFKECFKEDNSIGSFKRQYLAHLIRSMESLLCEHSGNDLFKIDVVALPDDDKTLDVGNATYYEGQYFSVFYHPRIETKQLRVLLAHELGHLFLSALLKKKDPKASGKQEETIATLFGLFAILDKNQFYKKDCSKFLHKGFEDVLEEFSLLTVNRPRGKYNVSNK